MSRWNLRALVGREREGGNYFNEFTVVQGCKMAKGVVCTKPLTFLFPSLAGEICKRPLAVPRLCDRHILNVYGHQSAKLSNMKNGALSSQCRPDHVNALTPATPSSINAWDCFRPILQYLFPFLL